ncbi:hypothetical protein ACWEPC_50720 [Nonomuraea sp. NPDC004297]
MVRGRATCRVCSAASSARSAHPPAQYPFVTISRPRDAVYESLPDAGRTP